MHKLVPVALLLLSHPVAAQWTIIDLAPFANARIQTYQPGAINYPEGPVTLGGVPFNIQRVGGNNAWNAELVSGSQPKILNVPIGVSGAVEVHTLINTFYGRPGPTVYVWLEFFGSGGAYHRKDLVGNVDVRDHFQNSSTTNTINHTTTINVVSTGSPENRLDKQQIVLPPEFRSQTLTSMRVTSTGGVSISDASIQGLTIRRADGQANSPCASLTVNGAGASGRGPFEVTVPPGGDLSLAWSGPANQALALLASNGLVPGQNLGNGLILDLQPTAMQVLFSGGTPLWGILFHTGSAGTAAQRFTVPGSAVGLTLYLQGVVFDTANTCAGAGLMTTASFAARL